MFLEVTFSDVPEGTYRVFVSTNLDNDGTLCEAGEICEYSPSLRGYERFFLLKENTTLQAVNTQIVPRFSTLSVSRSVGDIED